MHVHGGWQKLCCVERTFLETGVNLAENLMDGHVFTEPVRNYAGNQSKSGRKFDRKKNSDTFLSFVVCFSGGRSILMLVH